MEFVKYSGAGNDFVLIDNRNGTFPITDCEFISRLCNRHFGIGADGLLLLEGTGPWRMRILQADGHEVAMCGNGLRCFKAYLDSLGLSAPSESVEVSGRRLATTTHSDGSVTVQMGPPLSTSYGLVVDQIELDYVDTGVPHLIVPVKDIATTPVSTLGPALRGHTTFKPEGANVNFVQMLGPRKIAVRTYERGVEGETLACGTGVTAASLATAHHLHQERGPITARVASGATLTIDFQVISNEFTNVTMTGPALRLFSGCWD